MTIVLSEPLISKDPKEYERIRPYIKRFEGSVWFPKLREYLEENPDSMGFSGRVDKLIVLVYRPTPTMAKIMFHNQSGEWLSLAVAADMTTPSMGLHQKSVSEGIAKSWLAAATNRWRGVNPDSEVADGIPIGGRSQ